MIGRSRLRVLSALVLLGVVLGGCVPRTETGQKDVWDAAGVADFEMRDQQGKTVTKKDLLGGHGWRASSLPAARPVVRG
jgi:cytochrome oxidase Cu insertion factor (SCO1/SenC/PrrC family)